MDIFILGFKDSEENYAKDVLINAYLPHFLEEFYAKS